MRTRWDAYLICRERGHDADQYITTNITKGICKWCGSYFVTHQYEDNTPEDPDA